MKQLDEQRVREIVREELEKIAAPTAISVDKIIEELKNCVDLELSQAAPVYGTPE
jgi:hypothetical protein